MFIQDSFSVNVSGVRTNWELRVYPNGYDDENSGYLGIFVKHKEGNSHRYLIKSVVQLLDSTGENSCGDSCRRRRDVHLKLMSSRASNVHYFNSNRDVLIKLIDMEDTLEFKVILSHFMYILYSEVTLVHLILYLH